MKRAALRSRRFRFAGILYGAWPRSVSLAACHDDDGQGGIKPADGKLDRESLPKIKMHNRDGFTPDPAFDPARLFGKK